MDAPVARVNRPPDWEFLVAHHFPPRYARTIAVRVGRTSVHLCARCTGQVVGALTYLAVVLASPTVRSVLFDPKYAWPLALFPLLAGGDWLRQAVRMGESTNPLRLVSGALLGFASIEVLAFLVTGRWTSLAVALLVVAAYLGGIAVVLRVSGAWRRVLEEHLPGITVGT